MVSTLSLVCERFIIFKYGRKFFDFIEFLLP